MQKGAAIKEFERFGLMTLLRSYLLCSIVFVHRPVNTKAFKLNMLVHAGNLVDQ